MNETSDPMLASACQLAAGLRDGTWTSQQLLQAHVERIEHCNPAINGLVAHRFERAHAEAVAADERLSRGGDDLPPLLGVPCTVKEFLATEGMPHTGGLARRREVVADFDATVIARIKDAGAVIMGVSNVPEGGLWSETVNTLYGRTNSPWDARRTPGGSSGGEGALVASGCSPFGLGSDVGGSVRIPAALCGVPGHKPSGHTVSNHGHYPANTSSFLGIGPIARRVEDVRLVLSIIAGADPNQPGVSSPRPPSAIQPSDVTVYVPHEPLSMACNGAEAATRDAIAALRERGATIETISLPALKRSFWIWLAMMGSAGFESYAEILGDGEAIPVGKELIKRAIGRSEHTLPPLIIAAAEQLNNLAPILSMHKLVQEGHDLRADLQERLGDTGVLLMPTMPRPSPRHHGFMLRPWDTGGCGIFNVTGLPATTVPSGRSEAGLPFGAQVVGSHGNDHLTLQVAEWIERELGGWVRAEPV